MKEAEKNNCVLQSLKEFETLEDIQPSSEWTRSMMTRLSQSGRPAKTSYQVSGATLVLIFFVLANIGVILTLISDGSRQSSTRTSDLRAISREFLINPTSISQ